MLKFQKKCREYLVCSSTVEKERPCIFTAVTKSYLHHEMDRGQKLQGVKRIRIHDLRHSHISLLIDMGFSAVAIADRVDTKVLEITYSVRAHLFPVKADGNGNNQMTCGKIKMSAKNREM